MELRLRIKFTSLLSGFFLRIKYHFRNDFLLLIALPEYSMYTKEIYIYINFNTYSSFFFHFFFTQEEMAVLRMKLAEVLEENRMLHSELKTAVVHEILKEGGDAVNVRTKCLYL